MRPKPVRKHLSLRQATKAGFISTNQKFKEISLQFLSILNKNRNISEEMETEEVLLSTNKMGISCQLTLALEQQFASWRK